MVKVEILNLNDPSKCARLEYILNLIHESKSATLIDMDKQYNMKDGLFMVCIIYKIKQDFLKHSPKPSEILTPAELPTEEMSEYPKLEI